MRRCPQCHAPASDGDRFCEIDGTPLGAEVETLARAATARAAPSAPCPHCGAVDSESGDGFCAACGHRLVASAPTLPVGARRMLDGEERDTRVEEADGMAACSHPGLRHSRNEDAVAIAMGQTPGGSAFRVLVVCDGVSSSTAPERAAQRAARVACDALAHACRVGELAFDGARVAVVEAIRSAHVAVCVEGIDPAPGGTSDPPGSTCVVALVVDERLTVGWVGDSRAYWLTARGGELLTRDHSWVNEAVERGEATLEEALRSPYAHALTHCLGPLEEEEASRPFTPEIVTRRLAGPGWLLLCSDGLWNYAADADRLGALIGTAAASLGASPAPAGVARALVHEALVRGGHDNVSVALFAYPGGDPGRPSPISL